jgi:hypothetical protein
MRPETIESGEMQGLERIRIGVADGDAGWRNSLIPCLRRVGCHVVPCAEAASLARALDEHRRALPGSHLDLLIVGAISADARWLEALYALGVFDANVSVLLAFPFASPELERTALSLGATLVLSKQEAGLNGVILAARHLVERERRWQGEWVGNGLMRRSG